MRSFFHPCKLLSQTFFRIFIGKTSLQSQKKAFFRGGKGCRKGKIKNRMVTLENRRGSITCLYSYDSLYDLDVTDALQRFGNVKVEATSFKVSEPTEKIEIAPHLYELCDETQKNVLREQYDIEPFMIETISLERIFIDKVSVVVYLGGFLRGGVGRTVRSLRLYKGKAVCTDDGFGGADRPAQTVGGKI